MYGTTAPYTERSVRPVDGGETLKTLAMYEPTAPDTEKSAPPIDDAETLEEGSHREPWHDILVWSKIPKITHYKMTPSSQRPDLMSDSSPNRVSDRRDWLYGCFQLTLGTEKGGRRASIKHQQGGEIVDLPTGKVNIYGITHIVCYDASHFQETNFTETRENGTCVRNATWQGGAITIMEKEERPLDLSKPGGLSSPPQTQPPPAQSQQSRSAVRPSSVMRVTAIRQ